MAELKIEDTIIVVDISRSMFRRDFEPNRIQAVKNVLDFYTLIASAARDRTIDRNKAFEYWGQSIISFWTRYEPLFMQRRKMLGSDAFREIEWFKNESIKAHPHFSEIVETMLKEDRAAWREE